MTDVKRQHAAENAKKNAGSASRVVSCGNRVGIERGGMKDRNHENNESGVDKTDRDVNDERRAKKDAGIRYVEANDHTIGSRVINGMRWV